MRINKDERLKRKNKIENTNYLATVEVRDAIIYIKTAYGYKNIVQAQEVYKNWRKEYLKDIRRY
jgi:hypothetical protein|nr:MAG TPA: hypothetical protein [Caudoviricetes sp.]